MKTFLLAVIFSFSTFAIAKPLPRKKVPRAAKAAKAKKGTAAGKTPVLVDVPKQLKPALGKALGARFKLVPVAKPLPAEPTTEAVQKACSRANVQTLIFARPTKTDFKVQTYSCADGQIITTLKVNASPKATVKTLNAKTTQAIVDSLESPPPPEPVASKEPTADPTPTKEPDPEPAPVEKPRREDPVDEPVARSRVESPRAVSSSSIVSKPSALKALVGLKIVNRSLTFKDDIFSALGSYSLPLGPAIAFDVDFFPAAFFSDKWFAHFGINVGGDFLVGVKTTTKYIDTMGVTQQFSFTTGANQLKFGILAQATFWQVLVLGANIGYDIQSYFFNLPANAPASVPVPSANYGSFRFGVRPGLHFDLGTFAIDPFVAVALRVPVAYGDFAKLPYFPNMSGLGFDGQAGIDLILFKYLMVRAMFDYTQYGFSLKPTTANQSAGGYVAGGATDRYIGGNIMVGLRL